MAERRGNENLKPFGNGERTEEEERQLRVAGGKKSGEVRRQKARERKEWADLFRMALREGKPEKLSCLAEADRRNMRVGVAMKVKLITDALNGDKKAYELVMKYAGLSEPAAEEAFEAEAGEAPLSQSFLGALEQTAAEVFGEDEPNVAAEQPEQGE